MKRKNDDWLGYVGCGIIISWVAVWAAVIWIILHFIIKFW